MRGSKRQRDGNPHSGQFMSHESSAGKVTIHQKRRADLNRKVVASVVVELFARLIRRYPRVRPFSYGTSGTSS